MFLAQNLIQVVDEEYFSFEQKFMTFEYASGKLWLNMFFFCKKVKWGIYTLIVGWF